MLTLSLLTVGSLLTAAPALRSLTFDGETGPSYVLQNEHRYGPTGTKLTARAVGQRRNLFVATRLSVEAGLFERHTAVLLYAPLDLRTRATLPRDVDFRGQVFATGEVVDHRYLFDGYRGSYLFAAVRGERLRVDVGASVQIRNAAVEMSSVDSPRVRHAIEHDIGVVFALKARLRYARSEGFWAALEADGFSTFGAFERFSGAIYDVALTAGTELGDGVDGFLRLRLLGGGANVRDRDLENWANFFFALAGVRVDAVELLNVTR